MTRLPDDVRAFLTVVYDAIAIPFPATVGDTARYQEVLEERVRCVRIAVEALLDDRAVGDLPFQAGLLRELVDEHPPTGYVTADQARAALDEGETWMQAVRPDEEGDR